MWIFSYLVLFKVENYLMLSEYEQNLSKENDSECYSDSRSGSQGDCHRGCVLDGHHDCALDCQEVDSWRRKRWSQIKCNNNTMNCDKRRKKSKPKILKHYLKNNLSRGEMATIDEDSL